MERLENSRNHYYPFLMKVFLWIFILIFFIPSTLLPAIEGREEDLAVPIFGGDLSQKENEYLASVVREEAVKRTPYRVMTKENVFAILRDKNIDISRCTDVECAVDIGRVLQADKLVAGNVTIIQGVYYLNLSLYDVASAAIERTVSKECEGCDFKKIVLMVRDMCVELFGGAPSVLEEKEVRVRLKAKEGEVRKERRAIGIFLYPAIYYSFSKTGGLQYGGGIGWRVGGLRYSPLFFGFGMQWIGGDVSRDGADISTSFVEAYSILGYDFLKKGVLGFYIKPLFNYEEVKGDGESAYGTGFRFEGGIYSFFKHIHIFLGLFSDLDMTGIAFSIGGWF